ncbi:MAG TPA: S41 family peptidase [Terriglobia bacterium]|nr:S41 family peptidase [Terriglobia bacterium]
MKPTRRLVWFVIFAVSAGTVAGGLYGPNIEATPASGDDQQVQTSLKDFTNIYDIVQREYADKVDPNKAIYGPDGLNAPVGAIPGMLRTLDPHSNFFDPANFARIREEQEGKYYGVGMTIQAQLNKNGKLSTFVKAPIPGSPAFKAGIRPGDMIWTIEGKSAVGMDTTQVATLLKGPKGTVVHVAVQREGYEEPVEFTITRDEINNPTVVDAFMLKPGIAYIKLSGFDETTDDELTAALKKLNQGGDLKGLIFDLRDNPGGLLEEAVDVSDHFLSKDQLIVYHYGRASHEKRYYVTRGNHGDEYPMVVLIDRYTASASEIVSGALQDHDRALIMGEPSFGKGLVQTVYPLSEHAGLALTTAHYYTPSGRLIQRNYQDVSLYDYYNRDEEGPAPHSQVRLTDGGREVYGGGGITPDIEVPPPKLNDVQQKLADRGALYDFAQHYLGVHKTIPRDFQVTPEVVDELNKYLADEDIHVTPENVQDNLDYIKEQLRDLLVYDIYGEDVRLTLEAQNDPLVSKAVEALPQAAALLAHAKQYVASRENSR